MRLLRRELQTFYYSLYLGRKRREDEYIPLYSEPIPAKGNISPARGETVYRLFGADLDCDRVILMDNLFCGLNERSRLWIDVVPDLSGQRDVPGDYRVKLVARSRNVWAIAVRKEVGDGNAYRPVPIECFGY